MDRLFTTMLSMYGKKFVDMWSGIDMEVVKVDWAAKLGLYSNRELAAGLAGLDTRAWPPSLPEFLMLCRPPIDPATAHAEACAKYPEWLGGVNVTWSRPEVFWAAKAVGAFVLRETPFQYLSARWRAALEAASKDPVPAATPVIAPSEFVPADKGLVRKILQGCVIKPMPRNNAQIMVEQKAAAARLVAAALAARQEKTGDTDEQ